MEQFVCFVLLLATSGTIAVEGRNGTNNIRSLVGQERVYESQTKTKTSGEITKAASKSNETNVEPKMASSQNYIDSPISERSDLFDLVDALQDQANQQSNFGTVAEYEEELRRRQELRRRHEEERKKLIEERRRIENERRRLEGIRRRQEEEWRSQRSERDRVNEQQSQRAVGHEDSSSSVTPNQQADRRRRQQQPSFLEHNQQRTASADATRQEALSRTGYHHGYRRTDPTQQSNDNRSSSDSYLTHRSSVQRNPIGGAPHQEQGSEIIPSQKPPYTYPQGSHIIPNQRPGSAFPQGSHIIPNQRSDSSYQQPHTVPIQRPNSTYQESSNSEPSQRSISTYQEPSHTVRHVRPGSTNQQPSDTVPNVRPGSTYQQPYHTVPNVRPGSTYQQLSPTVPNVRPGSTYHQPSHTVPNVRPGSTYPEGTKTVHNQRSVSTRYNQTSQRDTFPGFRTRYVQEGQEQGQWYPYQDTRVNAGSYYPYNEQDTYSNCPDTGFELRFNGLTCQQAVEQLGTSLCYSHEYTSRSCCEVCRPRKQASRIGCEYGDHAQQCSSINPADCYDVRTRQTCCETCERMRKNNAPLGCEFGDRTARCESVRQNPGLCYRPDNQRICCETCSQTRNVSNPGCAWGDYNREFCQIFDDYTNNIRINCYSQQKRRLCCQSCVRLREWITDGLPDDCQYGDRPVIFSTSHYGRLNCSNILNYFSVDECRTNPAVYVNCCYTCHRRLNGLG